MNIKLKEQIKNIIEFFCSIFIYHIRVKRKLEKILLIIMPDIDVIDIGASYFPHNKWKLFMKSKKINWYAIDPNEKNINYTDDWIWESKIKKLPYAADSKTGESDFYITNVDSGSSMLKPSFNENISHRSEIDYFLPFQKIKIKSTDINDIINNEITSLNTPIIIKLDTQGTEMRIIENIKKDYLKNIICFELESNLHAEPAYENSPHISKVFKFFQDNEFELMDIEVMRDQNKKTNDKIKSKNIPNECDLVFIKKSKKIREYSVEFITSCIAVYFCYGLYEEILFLVEYTLKNKKIDKNLEQYLNKILAALN
jgi:FkbM family methyltransferase